MLLSLPRPDARQLGLMTTQHTPDRWAWTRHAMRTIEAENNRSADTHLCKIDLPRNGAWTCTSRTNRRTRTGSLKHRLARSLFLCGLCNGWIGPNQTVVEASSGSTAISEAYFARLLGLPYVAVMPRCTAPRKIREIEALGGRCQLVDDAGDTVAARCGTRRRARRPLSGSVHQCRARPPTGAATTTSPSPSSSRWP